MRVLHCGGVIRPDKSLKKLDLPESGCSYAIRIERAGLYALFTEHHP